MSYDFVNMRIDDLGTNVWFMLQRQQQMKAQMELLYNRVFEYMEEVQLQSKAERQQRTGSTRAAAREEAALKRAAAAEELAAAAEGRAAAAEERTAAAEERAAAAEHAATKLE